MVPEATYPAIVDSYQWGKTNAGKQQIVVTFKIIGEECRGQRIPWFGVFTDNTWKRVLESLRYCGWKGDDLNNLGNLDQEVEIQVEHSEWDGKTNARVSWVNQPGGGTIKLNNPMDDSEVAKFAAKMKKRAAKVGEVDGAKHSGSNGAPTSSAPASSGSDGSGDGDEADGEDLPF